MNLKNYFSWIANFGVVPLLLLAAFLLLPCFFSLFALFVLEIRVFETITSLLAGHFLQHFDFVKKIKYLPSLARTVKALIFMALGVSLNVHASVQKQTILMAKGEHKELEIIKLKKFTIGNPQVVSHKLSNKNNTLLIKGKKLGFTEVIAWRHKLPKQVFQIYILSKQKHLKLLHLAQTFKSIELHVQAAGPLLIVRGELSQMANYQLIRALYGQYSKEVFLDLKLTRKLRNLIIADIYQSFYKEGIERVSCESQKLEIRCSYPKEFPPSKQLSKRLHARYQLQLFPRFHQTNNNFQVKIKLIQIEKSHGEEFQFGLDKLKSPLTSLFDEGLSSLLKENQVFIRENDLHLSTLAEPQLIIQNNKSAIVEIGSQIPYPIQNGEIVQTDWRFAGLKIVILAKKLKQGFDLNFKIEFTNSGNLGEITGSREESHALIYPNEPFNLFQIGYQTSGKHQSKIPVLGSIPLLGKIFTSHSNQKSYKKILGYITIQELPHEL